MKFNVFTRTKRKVVNHAGEKAFKLSPQMELYSAVVNSTLEKTFYESDSKRIEKIKNLIGKNDPKFVAKLAIYTRQKMHLRSIPIVLTVELAKIHSGDNLVSNTINEVIQRADEITELLAYYQFTNKRTGAKKLNKLSKQVQKGIAMALNQFDAYQFAKYNRKTAVSFKDAIFLTHPKPKDNFQQEIFDQIIMDNLKTPYTWETQLSTLGQNRFTSEDKKRKAFAQKWSELIDSNKLGYMALMRNLRNILDSDVSYKHITKVAFLLSDEERVQKSKQLPFRFFAAYQELENHSSPYASYILSALETAIKASVLNIKGFNEYTRTVIACDVSGSMIQPISSRSKIMAYDVGLVLGMLFQHRSKNVITGLFGNIWKRYNLPKDNILSNVMKLKRIEGEVGYSTNGYKVIQDFYQRREIVDKIMIFTDCQLWDSNQHNSDYHIEILWKRYKTFAPEAKLYIFDLMGYGHAPLQVLQNDVYLIAGWSDKIFEVLEALENGDSVINHINENVMI